VVQPITPAMAKALGQSEPKAYWSETSVKARHKPAGWSGGDIILDLNGKAINDSNELRNTVAMMQPGETATLRISRNGSTPRYSR